MKKLLFAAVAVFAFGFTNAQEGGFKAGVHAGLPIGDAGDAYTFNAGVDIAYLWNVAENFKAGATTGYSYFAGKEIVIPGVSVGGLVIIADQKIKNNGAFIPVAATGQYSFSESFFGGLDLGYAIYSGDGDGDGGFLYQPKVGYQNEKIEVYASYKGISVSGGSVSTVGLGFNYKF